MACLYARALSYPLVAGIDYLCEILIIRYHFGHVLAYALYINARCFLSL
jgi:hypothetical protein